MESSTARVSGWLATLAWGPALTVVGIVGSGTARAAEPAAAAPAAMDPPGSLELAAANGRTGAGTRTGDVGRAWAEIGVSTWQDEAAAWSLFGLGLRLSDALEIEALLPFGYGWEDEQDLLLGGTTGGGGTESSLWLGNPYFGVNLIALREPHLRLRLGGGFTLPVVNADDGLRLFELLPLWAAGSQDPQLWLPGGPSLVGRARAEFWQGALIFSVDLAIIATLAGKSADQRTTLQPALEAAGYAVAGTLIGLRLPFVWDNLDEQVSLSMVPFLRQELGSFFAEAQFSVNLSGPYGPSLAEGPIWGMQIGAGARF